MTDVLHSAQFTPSGHEHGGVRTRLPQESEDRCTSCGHRLPDLETGRDPIGTRYQALRDPRRVFNEHPRRFAARRAGS